MRSRPMVFISSTSGLNQDRRAVAESLRDHFHPYLFEDDRARGQSPRDHCRKMIAESEAFVGIVGSRYGSTVGDGDDRSICEWEFDVASKRDDIEIMMMLSRVPQAIELDPEQGRFRDRISSFGRGVWCRFFTTTQELVDSVKHALMTWLVEFFCESMKVLADRRRRATRLAVVVAVVAVSTVIAAVALNIFLAWFTSIQLLGISAVSIAMILLGFLVIAATE